MSQRSPAVSRYDLLLSLRGRISRKEYWILGAVVWLVGVGLYPLTLALMGEWQVFREDPDAVSLRARTVGYLATLAVWWWPGLLLLAKRLRDVGRGRTLVGLYVILWMPSTVLAFPAEVSGVVGRVGDLYPDRMLHAAADALGLLAGVLGIAVGFVKGHPGPNRYGPDPLAR